MKKICLKCNIVYDDGSFCEECGGKLREIEVVEEDKTEEASPQSAPKAEEKPKPEPAAPSPKPAAPEPAEEPISQEDPNEKYKYKNNIYTGDKYLLNSGAGFTDKIKPYFLGSFAIVVIIHIILAVKGYMNALNFYNKYAELEIGGFNSGATIVQVVIAGVISVVIVMAIIYAVVMAGMAIYNLKNIEKIKFYLPANVDDPKELMNTLAPKLKKYYSQKSGDELTKEKLAYKIILKPYEGCFSVIISNKGFYRTYGCYKKAINEIPNIAHTIQSELEKINPIPQSNFADKSSFYNVNTAMLAVCLVITAVVYGSINMPSFMSSGDILEDMDNFLGDYEDMDWEDIDTDDIDFGDIDTEDIESGNSSSDLTESETENQTSGVVPPASSENAEEENEDPYNDMENLPGSWWDYTSYRCHMNITKIGPNLFDIRMEWGIGADGTSVWSMQAKYSSSDRSLSYSDCVNTIENNVSKELIYESGTGKFYFAADDILIWVDDVEDMGANCEFHKEEY